MHPWQAPPRLHRTGVCSSTGLEGDLVHARRYGSERLAGRARAWAWKKLPSSGTSVAAAVYDIHGVPSSATGVAKRCVEGGVNARCKGRAAVQPCHRQPRALDSLAAALVATAVGWSSFQPVQGLQQALNHQTSLPELAPVVAPLQTPLKSMALSGSRAGGSQRHRTRSELTTWPQNGAPQATALGLYWGGG